MHNITDPVRNTHLNPAEYVIFVFKGVRAAARKIGCDPSAVSRWRNSKDRTGFTGNIPSVFQRVIISIAKRDGLDITSEDLDFGRLVISQDQYE